MSKEVVSYMLSGMDNMKSLQVQLILQCAPFLKGIKIACILNITEENSRELYEILEGTGIKFKILTRNYGKCLVFLYRRESFSRYLKRTDVREFLGSYGYEDVEPEKMLERLSKRVCQYSDGEISSIPEVHFPVHLHCWNVHVPHEYYNVLPLSMHNVPSYVLRST